MSTSKAKAPFPMENPVIDNPMMRPFMDFWSKVAKETTGAAWQSGPSPMTMLNPASFFREWEGRWMDAMSDSADAYMRTPQFLEWMRHQSDLVVKSKQQADNTSQEFARNAGIPTARDISGLYERLHSFEDNLIRRLDQELLHRMNGVETGIGSRLNGDLADRLDRFEETLKSLKNGGEVRHHLDSAIEDIHERLNRLETSFASALERIELKLDRVDSPPSRSPRETSTAKHAQSGSKRNQGPIQSRSASFSAGTGKGKSKAKPQSKTQGTSKPSRNPRSTN